MRRERTSNKIFVAFLALLLLFAAVFGGQSFLPALAAVKYSGALEDLQRDENFNASDYPDDLKDFSLQVIQIAESAEGDLIVYTYQPCQKLHYLVATDINMSLSDSAEGTKLYGLTLLSCNGVFGKYAVNDFTVNGEEAKRYYNVSSIYRDFDRYLDEQSSLDDTITKIAFSVGKLFVAETVNGKPVYYEQIQEVVPITDKYVGNVMYEGESNIGWGFSKNAVNAMYVAFDTDREIDRLYKASVTYATQSLQYKVKANFMQFWNDYKTGTSYDVKKGEAVPHEPVTLDYSAKDSAGRYSWYQIQSVNEFKNNLSKNGMELTTDAIAGLKGKKWILNFANAECEAQWAKSDPWYKFLAPFGMALDDPTFRTTIVSDVSVLSLEFEHDEKMYNLGAVDGGSTPSGKPSNRLPGYDDNNEKFSTWQWIKDKIGIKSSKMPWWGWLIIALVAVGIVLTVCGFIFRKFGEALKKIFVSIVKAIGKAILWLLKGLWWLICAPFRGIAKLVKKDKSGSKSGNRRGGSKRSRKRARA